MPPVYIWTNDEGKDFGAKADNVDEARRELDDSPIISDREAQIAHDTPPVRIEHDDLLDDEEG